MHVLEHDPMTFFGGFSKDSICILFLTLSHRNVSECSVFNLLAVGETNLFNVWSWINTGEQNEEGWSTRFGLLV